MTKEIFYIENVIKSKSKFQSGKRFATYIKDHGFNIYKEDFLKLFFKTFSYGFTG